MLDIYVKGETKIIQCKWSHARKKIAEAVPTALMFVMSRKRLVTDEWNGLWPRQRVISQKIHINMF